MEKEGVQESKPQQKNQSAGVYETWSVTQKDIRRLKTFQMRCPQVIVGVTLWDMWCNVDRPLATEATATVQTERKEEAARRDLLAVGGCHQQRLD